MKIERKANDAVVKRWRVSSKETKMNLLSFLREKNPDALSVKALKRAIDGKWCTVNGKTETFSSHMLKENDVVVFMLPQKKHRRELLTVLYEDQDLLIVDKPSGLTSENRYFAPLLSKPAQLIHRLDKETSGAIMLAKNPEFLEQMISIFREKKVHKRYLALVDGSIEHEKGKIDQALRKKRTSVPGQALFETAEKGGCSALTYWKCLKKFKTASLLLCEPVTGRTHQLRVHLNSIGHPILGDTHYCSGFRCSLRPQRQLLHAYALKFMHPKTKKKVHVQAPLPFDFKEALRSLRGCS